MRRTRHAKRLALAPILAATLAMQGCDPLTALTGVFMQLSSALGPVQQVVGLVSKLPGNPLSSGLGSKVLGVLNTASQVGSKVQQAQALTNKVSGRDGTKLSPVDTVRQASSLVSGVTSLLGSD